MQHTFVKLCQQDPQRIRENLAGWLCAVCRNKVFDDLRLRKRVQALPEFAAIESRDREPIEMIEEHEISEMIDDVIGQLPPAQRNAIELWRTGMRYPEIAAQLKKEETSIRVAVHRAIGSLKSHPLIARWLGGPAAADGELNAHVSLSPFPSRAT